MNPKFKIFGMSVCSLLIVAAIVLLVLLWKKRNCKVEGFKLLKSTGSGNEPPKVPEGEVAAPSEEKGDEKPLKVASTKKVPKGFSNREMHSELLSTGEVDANAVKPSNGKAIVPKDLLPKDSEAQKWAAANPLADNDMKGQNFLDATFHNGVNTVGQSLRNANLQLRSEPANPTAKVSPWLQTTIDPDLDRRPLE
jgi:hypothetical protein